MKFTSYLSIVCLHIEYDVAHLEIARGRDAPRVDRNQHLLACRDGRRPAELHDPHAVERLERIDERHVGIFAIEGQVLNVVADSLPAGALDRFGHEHRVVVHVRLAVEAVGVDVHQRRAYARVLDLGDVGRKLRLGLGVEPAPRRRPPDARVPRRGSVRTGPQSPEF